MRPFQKFRIHRCSNHSKGVHGSLWGTKLVDLNIDETVAINYQRCAVYPFVTKRLSTGKKLLRQNQLKNMLLRLH